ncbi:MAG: DUF3565 domain-containing protein, partial [Gemmatimonadota bacterium]
MADSSRPRGSRRPGFSKLKRRGPGTGTISHCESDLVLVLCRIVSFHQDEEFHWVAELECGHQQHVRHDPPWQVRPWVLSGTTRAEHLGTTLDCPLCSQDLRGLSEAQIAA